MKFKVRKTDKILQNKGFMYNVQVIVDGAYCGIGKFCKNKKEVRKFIILYKINK